MGRKVDAQRADQCAVGGRALGGRGGRELCRGVRRWGAGTAAAPLSSCYSPADGSKPEARNSSMTARWAPPARRRWYSPTARSENDRGDGPVIHQLPHVGDERQGRERRPRRGARSPPGRAVPHQGRLRPGAEGLNPGYSAKRSWSGARSHPFGPKRGATSSATRPASAASVGSVGSPTGVADAAPPSSSASTRTARDLRGRLLVGRLGKGTPATAREAAAVTEDLTNPQPNCRSVCRVLARASTPRAPGVG